MVAEAVPFEVMERARERERRARLRAESLLEQRSRELFYANERLLAQNEALERDKRELELLHEIALRTQDDLDPRAVMHMFLVLVCEKLQWPLGHLYLLDTERSGCLRSSNLWYMSDVERYGSFRDLSLQRSPCSGEGLPGRVLESGEPIWIESVADDSSMWRQAGLVGLGLHSAFAVPIRRNREIIAVAEFFINTERAQDERVLRLITTAAYQLGSVLERHQRERELRQRYEELTRMHDALKTTQAALVHQEKLASLGQLAAGVAHEINNPVGFISSNLHTLRSYAASVTTLLQVDQRIVEAYAGSGQADPVLIEERRSLGDLADLDFLMTDLDDVISESIEGVERVREIVLGLRSFARVDSDVEERFDVNDCVRHALKLVRNEIKYHCELEIELDEVAPILGNSGEISQVLMNLLVNAGHAVAERGVITVRTRQLDDQVRIQVSDTGTGIEPRHLEEIFTPFFTTKPAGRGTGLGLSISHGIVHKHGGEITVQSTPGEGTTFTIDLPTKRSRGEPIVGDQPGRQSESVVT